jgi:hypothetical protein
MMPTVPALVKNVTVNPDVTLRARRRDRAGVADPCNHCSGGCGQRRNPLIRAVLVGAPGRIRTCDTFFRREVLFP